MPILRNVLDHVNWRGTGAIPLVTVQAAIKRLQSRPGLTVAEAASTLGRSITWVEAWIADGTVRPLRGKGNPDRIYLSEPMMRRLRKAGRPRRKKALDALAWIGVGEAALDAGVTQTTVMKWAERGEIERTQVSGVWRYRRDAVRTRARHYWQTTRFQRAALPDWLGAADVAKANQGTRP